MEIINTLTVLLSFDSAFSKRPLNITSPIVKIAIKTMPEFNMFANDLYGGPISETMNASENHIMNGINRLRLMLRLTYTSFERKFIQQQSYRFTFRTRCGRGNCPQAEKPKVIALTFWRDESPPSLGAPWSPINVIHPLVVQHATSFRKIST
jgi:hypothetical protein